MLLVTLGAWSFLRLPDVEITQKLDVLMRLILLAAVAVTEAYSITMVVPGICSGKPIFRQLKHMAINEPAQESHP